MTPAVMGPRLIVQVDGRVRDTESFLPETSDQGTGEFV